MSILVSFDVDGTLIRSTGSNANKLHRDAFSAAFKTVFGLDTTIDVIPHHGSTDTLILVAVLEAHGIDKSKVLVGGSEGREGLCAAPRWHWDRWSA